MAGCFALMTALALAQTLPPTVPHGGKGILLPAHLGPRIERRTFFIDGQKYLCSLIRTEESSNVAWNPASPLPIGLAQIQNVAQAELHKLVKNDADWQVSDFQISRFSDGQGWYYTVTLKPAVQLDTVASDSLVLLLDFSGNPGRIGHLTSW